MERYLFREPWPPYIAKAIAETIARPIKVRIGGKPVDLTFHEYMVEMMNAYALRGKLRKAMQIGAYLKFLPRSEPKQVTKFNWTEEQEKLFRRIEEMNYDEYTEKHK